MTEQKAYYESLSEAKRYGLTNEEQRNEELLRAVTAMQANFSGKQMPNPENSGVIQNTPKAADSNK